MESQSTGLIGYLYAEVEVVQAVLCPIPREDFGGLGRHGLRAEEVNAIVGNRNPSLGLNLLN